VSSGFKIDLNETFPHLPAAPIVEAVIHWQARAERPWTPDDLQAKLAERLPDYPHREAQRQFVVEMQGMMAEDESHTTTSQRGGWCGLRVSTADKRYIAQFTRDGLVLSRLQPYEHWDKFSSEARRLWGIFIELATPSEVQRLGVRFINRITSAKLDNLKAYLKEPPTCPCSLPLSAFTYQSSFRVPDRPFEVGVVKMMQPAIPFATQDFGLILDIAVLTSKPIPCDDATLDRLLPEMRWLKNRIFFELLTESAVKAFQEK